MGRGADGFDGGPMAEVRDTPLRQTIVHERKSTKDLQDGALI
jgi:hypothetical protein